ncbi:serine hydrolase-domain-containing protein [Leptodontidium sp. MPI-SDFR-AT-0119]|nr:serine hydrolase-domain-containing protein [Leptodontidium sp. MPI-SDFR-AT-0119]
MKILCLHGILSSGALFEFQTGAFRKLLGEDHEYIFIDGEIEVKDQSDSAAQFRWTRNAGPSEIQSAHEYIRAVIEEDGPFQGVIGFSDGAAMAASIILQHETNKLDQPPPFKFAILFSCPLVSSPDKEFAKEFYEATYNRSLAEMFKAMDVSVQEFPGRSGDVDLVADGLDQFSRDVVVKELWEATATTQSELRMLMGLEESQVLVKDTESLPKIYHPALLSQRVRIPTACITGSNDPYFKAVQMTQELFDKRNTKIVVHSGGHNLPKQANDLKNAVAAAKWAIRQSQLTINQR